MKNRKNTMEIPALNIDLEAFEAMIDKSDECWFWDGPRDHGYHPVFKIDGVEHSVIHILYQDMYGNISADKAIKSKCGIRGCINPVHKRRVGRAHCSKLTDTKVKQILDSQESTKTLAEKYGVSQVNICNIWRGKSWAHLGGKRGAARKKHLRVKTKPLLVRTGVSTVSYNPLTKKYIPAYLKKPLGEFGSLEEAAAARKKHIEELT